jgi:hypothetical protein
MPMPYDEAMSVDVMSYDATQAMTASRADGSIGPAMLCVRLSHPRWGGSELRRAREAFHPDSQKS